jgi:DNA adenine methylase
VIPYAGGKYMQAKWIGSFVPANVKNYMEVFGGAMWVYWRSGIFPKRAIYNDFNPYMYNLMSCSKEYAKFQPYIEVLKPMDQETFSKCQKYVVDFVKRKEKLNAPDFQLAANYVYIVTQCFSGLISGNIAKAKLAPRKYGDAVLDVMPFVNTLRKQDIQNKLDRLETSNLSYELAIEKYDAEDMVMYLDPPYYGTEKYYAFHDFGKKDHENLSEALKSCKSKWILSYYDFPDLAKWYPKDKYRWEKKEYRKLAGAEKGGNLNAKGEEILVMNYDKEKDLDLFFD